MDGLTSQDEFPSREGLLTLVDDLERTVGWLRREVEQDDPTMARPYAGAAVLRAHELAMAVEAWSGPSDPHRGRPDGAVSLAGENVGTAVGRLSDQDLRDLHGQLSWDLHTEKRVGPAEWLRESLSHVKAEMDRRGWQW
ncbi:hypothetical protein [Arthrobacter sp. NEB 688]|uniref:hypothetical protein n=1 Tax=Arthrobacter sp. NEB 688 TaxID=904039 RepID=UPI001563A5A9|nr:hypothetical protein [Arthrobacter sp. NEB 688]QKE84405.1 hypothetical protein HL663_10970 [Arthrobacter sp. NEB 688]